MLPSGPWRGYWEQLGWGRQLMHQLVLSFADGLVEGRGTDCIGPFTFTGRYDAQGTVALTKQYQGRHSVAYQGTYDGEGTLFGRWSIGTEWTGPFALSPVHPRPDADAPIEPIR